jgi:acetate kinase
MTDVLVLNCGSSSIKYRVFDAALRTAVDGILEGIGEQPALTHRKGERLTSYEVAVADHGEAVSLLMGLLSDPDVGAVTDPAEFSVVGHRVVHGGRLSESSLVTDESLGQVRSFSTLAPLHNPHCLAGIEEARRLLPAVPHVMVFDTAFHQTLPPKAYLYGVPYEYLDAYAIRKYGFHGTSHKYVAGQAAEMLGRPDAHLVTCHLGAGSSLAAVKGGESVDTTMGFSPLEGVMMGTRAGDLDPAIVQYLVDRHGFDLANVFHVLNHESGLKGLSGVSNDVRVIEERARRGDERCAVALEVFCYRVAKYIGAYAVALGQLDAVVFTGGIGENAASLRSWIASYLEILGVRIDERKNREAVGQRGDVSGEHSEVRLLVIPTDEELVIAREALDVVKAL